MSVVYIETSALLAWLFGEKRAADVARAVNSAETAVSSLLTCLEAARAIVRAESYRQISPRQASQLRAMVRNQTSGWRLMHITNSIVSRAEQSFPIEPVRSLDAIHLSTVLEFSRRYPELTVLTLDKRLISNLERLGFESDLG